MEAASKAASSNTVVNVFLVGSFVGLGIRSMNQQSEIEALEAQKEALLKSNKSVKQTLWNWKQQLFAEASSATANNPPLVPLSKLKLIYGEVSTIPSAGDSEKKDGRATTPKIII